jgi:hypothetical protein
MFVHMKKYRNRIFGWKIFQCVCLKMCKEKHTLPRSIISHMIIQLHDIHILSINEHHDPWDVKNPEADIWKTFSYWSTLDYIFQFL